MVVPTIESAVLANKFRGCLLGSLLGDCLGAPFEGEATVTLAILQRYFDKMEDPNFKSPQKSYTDDTAMTKSVASSLIHHASFDAKDMARRFVTEYFQDPRRGYGQAVGAVFHKWKESKLEDVWKPAREQFNGSGSAGNGAAMRISPVGLFCYKDQELLIKTAAQCSELTHTHRLGVHGAILQALAIQQCILQKPEEEVDLKKFSANLIDKMSRVEPTDLEALRDPGEEPKSYAKQLNLVQKLLEKENANNYEVVETLGHNVLAVYSVPTAIYCYLRAQKPIGFIKTENTFRRVLQYAISLGGDTDTIASMAGALVGAHLGASVIDPNTLKHCEDVDTITSLADELYDAASSSL